MIWNTNSLAGNPVTMFDAKTDSPLRDFDSIGQAGRFCREMSSSKFALVIKRKEIKEVIFKGQTKKVYFKEKP